MFVDCGTYPSDQLYFLMTQTIIPRPIAWVLSDDGAGTYNLAPFSFFNAVTAEPPILMISVGWKDDITRKDTWINIQERNDFVVHIPSEEEGQHVVDSAEALPHGISEINKIGLKLETVEGQRLPRVAGVKVAYFCQKFSIQEIGRSQQALILGEVKGIWLDDALVKQEHNRLIVDPMKLNPLARLGGKDYSLLAKPFSIQRK